MNPTLERLFRKYIRYRDAAGLSIGSPHWNHYVAKARRVNEQYRAIEPRPVAP
jgi:hypothetical protein